MKMTVYLDDDGLRELKDDLAVPPERHNFVILYASSQPDCIMKHPIVIEVPDQEKKP